jgi:tetratricopeptide (TPR) repeat protein
LNLSFFIIFTISLFNNTLFSQKFVKVKKSNYKIEEEGFKEAWKHVKKGNKLFKMNKKGAYIEALEHYLTANNYNEDNAALNYLIGICYLKTSEHKKALSFIDNANFIYGNLTDDILYWLGNGKPV